MEWQTTPILVGELDGRHSDEFVLFSGHLDSWEVGAMDNGSANATMLEVGRLLAMHRDGLYRGLRLVFWSGHSHGRYSGSTWYVDNHWEELYDRCVAHVNVDSTGARGATFYANFPANLASAPSPKRLSTATPAKRAAPAVRAARRHELQRRGHPRSS
ncbi:MAG: M28 family peptidase [Caldilineaceae bacterium]